MILLKGLLNFLNSFNRINVFHRGYGAKICLPHVFQRLPVMAIERERELEIYIYLYMYMNVAVHAGSFSASSTEPLAQFELGLQACARAVVKIS